MCVAQVETSEEYAKRVAKAKDLQRSFPLMKTLWSESDEVRQLTDVLLEQVRTVKARKRFKKDSYENNLIVLIGNLVKAYTYDNMWVAYSRSPRGYRDAQRYNPANVSRNMAQLTTDLVELGYLRQEIGTEVGFQKYCSRGKATSKLLALWKSYGITYDLFHEHPESELLLLKNFKTKQPLYVDYEETSETQAMRDNLMEINNYIEKQNISLNISDDIFEEMIKGMEEKEEKKKGFISCRAKVAFDRIRLKRIFNNCTFNHGGRFYHAWWLEVPKEYRKHITINGQKTVEIDYSTLHPSILYAWKGLSTPTAPYGISGYGKRLRPAIKLAMLIMLNANSRQATLKAIRNKLKDTFEEFEDSQMVRKLHDAIKKTHAPIAEYFNSGIGVELQRIDSDIAERVMMRLNGLRPTVALPVHDSFIVPAYAEEFAKQVMLEEFERELKQTTQVDSKIDKKTKAIRNELKSGTLRIPTTLDIGSMIDSGDSRWIWEIDMEEGEGMVI